MLSLKIKAIIYRYTGIYLAKKEEQDYLNSSMCIKEAEILAFYPENELDFHDARSICLGTWQTKHGFVRPYSLIRYKRPYFFYKIIAWFVDFYNIVRYDISHLRSKHTNIK